jgi:uncharacterized protein YraI
MLVTQIFISYRRSDSQSITDRIYERLVKAFGRKAIFKDVDDIPPGVDFPTYLQGKVQGARVVLIIIGQQWASASYTDGSLRLHDADDFVRIEIELALSMTDALVIPIFVNNASMPAASQLPPAIRTLTRLNAMQVRNDPDFFNDSNRLIRKLKDLNIGNQRNYAPFIGSGIVFILVLLLAVVFANNFLNPQNNTVEPTTEVALVSSDTPELTAEITELSMNPNDAHATGAANAYATLTAVAPTATPTISPTPTATPISASDIQNTAMAETFGEATNAALTQTTLAQVTENARQTQLFIAGETATYIVNLSLTPNPTSTRTPTPTRTASPSPTNRATTTPTTQASITASSTISATVTVNVASANLRSGPGTNYSVLEAATEGESFDVIARYADWFLIDVGDNQQAWVSSAIVDLSVEDSNLIEIASTIPATPIVISNPSSNSSSNSSVSSCPQDLIQRTSLLSIGATPAVSASYSVVRTSAGGANIVGYLQEGARMTVISGPLCQYEYLPENYNIGTYIVYWEITANPALFDNAGKISRDVANQEPLTNSIRGYVVEMWAEGEPLYYVARRFIDR